MRKLSIKITSEGFQTAFLKLIIRFNARDVKLVEIYKQISEVYRKNTMSDGMVRKWRPGGLEESNFTVLTQETSSWDITTTPHYNKCSVPEEYRP